MWKYIGESHLPGVPARDLTDAEFEAFEACTEPGQVWLERPDGEAYLLNVVPVAGVKVLADGTEHGYGLATCGLYEYVSDAAPPAGGRRGAAATEPVIEEPAASGGAE